MLKVDFHSHSTLSPDGGIKPEQYLKALDEKLLDYIAVTDHNSLDMALQLHKKIGDRIIVGEEIMTESGELIGLFLTKLVPAGLPLEDTAKAIKDQGGLVYVPHPFETVRKGVSEENLGGIAKYVDIVEVHNGRAVFQNYGPKAATWARLNRVAAAAASDAHGYRGLGTTYTTLAESPTSHNLLDLLTRSRLITRRPPLKTLLYPKANRLRKRLARS